MEPAAGLRFVDRSHQAIRPRTHDGSHLVTVTWILMRPFPTVMTEPCSSASWSPILVLMSVLNHVGGPLGHLSVRFRRDTPLGLGPLVVVLCPSLDPTTTIVLTWTVTM